MTKRIIVNKRGMLPSRCEYNKQYTVISTDSNHVLIETGYPIEVEDEGESRFHSDKYGWVDSDYGNKRYWWVPHGKYIIAPTKNLIGGELV